MFLEIDGHQVFALDIGKGPRTFVAHSGWIGNFEDWIAALAPMSKHWRCVIYDHRGAGETRSSPERITPQALVDDLFAVMEKLDIERCILGGFSRGTVTALRAAMQQPGRFDGLVLLNGHAGVPDPKAPPVARVPPSNWPGETFAQRLSWFARRCTPEPDVDHVRAWAVDILSRATPEAADRLFTMEFTDEVDWPARLADLQLPTLLIHGEKDAFVQAAAMRHLCSLLPRAKLIEFAGAGHLPAMTRPADVAQAILSHFGG